MRRTLAAVAIAVVAFGAAPAGAADPSHACDAGVVPPSASPAGAGVRSTEEPLMLTLTACVTHAPAAGHARVKADASEPSLTIVADGDPATTAAGCSDGYTAAKGGASGVSIYHAPDGGFTSRARPRSTEELAGSVIEECTVTPASV